MQMRKLPAHDSKARTRDARSTLKIKAEPLAELHMILRLECKCRWPPATAQLNVRALIITVGHRFVQQVRQAELPFVELGLHAGEFLLGLRQSAREAVAFGDECGNMLAVCLRHPHFLRICIASGTQPISFNLPVFAPLLERACRLDIEQVAAACE